MEAAGGGDIANFDMSNLFLDLNLGAWNITIEELFTMDEIKVFAR